MQNIRFLLKYIFYKLFAKHKKGFGLHSPFLYSLVSQVINNSSSYYAMDDIWNLRDDLLESNQEITVNDFGAGSKIMKSEKRKVADIVNYSAVKMKYGELLFRLIVRFKPSTILELGTSVGISTLYLAMPNSKSNVYTMEGCEETAAVARINFSLFDAKNIQQVVGNIDENLEPLLNKINKLDFVFFDANHTQEATIKYFNACVSKVHEKTIFVFDDIHWSKGMESAWKQLKKNSKVTLSIDLFYMGIIFFDTKLSKENFVIKF